MGAIIVYRIPQFHGLPMINGKPFLASDGHKESVRVLMAVRTKLDIPSARFDQFLSDEKERMIDSIIMEDDMSTMRPRGQRTPGSSPSFAMRSKEPLLPPKPIDTATSSLEQSQKIDDSPGIGVKNIIKKLQSSDSLPVFPAGATTPTDKKSAPLTSTHVTLQSEGRDTMQADTTKAAEEPQSKATLAQVSGETPTEYENPQSVLQVAKSLESGSASLNSGSKSSMGSASKTSIIVEKDEEQDKEEDDLPHVESDPIINRERYEGSDAVKAGELYEQIPLETITMTIPGRAKTKNKGSLFMLTGGCGVTNFRPGESQSPLLHSHTTSAITILDNCGNVPCVITYQVPSLS